MDNKDNVRPDGQWTFDENVASCFPDMLKRSIPIYETMRSLCFNVGQNYEQRKTCIMDIGCSDGMAIEPFIEKFGANNTYKLYDVSEPMLAKCRERYKKWEGTGLLEIGNFDIKNGVPKIDSSIILSVLTLQFTPIEYRHKIVQSVYDALVDGGAFILVEKVLGNTYALDDMLVREYYNIKKANAYTQEQIASKRKSLEGVLVPITAKWNEALLYDSGFKQVDCFYRYLNFAGWVAVK